MLVCCLKWDEFVAVGLVCDLRDSQMGRIARELFAQCAWFVAHFFGIG